MANLKYFIHLQVRGVLIEITEGNLLLPLSMAKGKSLNKIELLSFRVSLLIDMFENIDELIDFVDWVPFSSSVYDLKPFVSLIFSSERIGLN